MTVFQAARAATLKIIRHMHNRYQGVRLPRRLQEIKIKHKAMTKQKTNYSASIKALEVGQTLTLPKTAKSSVVATTAYRIAYDLNRAYTVSAKKGQTVKVTRTK